MLRQKSEWFGPIAPDHGDPAPRAVREEHTINVGYHE